MSTANASVFDGMKFTIPLADVLYIEKNKVEICVVMRGATGNYANGHPRPNCPYLYGDEKDAFLSAWCQYRAMVDGLASAAPETFIDRYLSPKEPSEFTKVMERFEALVAGVPKAAPDDFQNYIHEGALLLTRVINGCLQDQIKVATVAEAWTIVSAEGFRLRDGDEAHLSQYRDGIWQVIERFDALAVGAPKAAPDDLQNYIQERCAKDPGFKDAYEAGKLRDHFLEGSLLLIYQQRGIVQPPMDVDDVEEAQAYLKVVDIDGEVDDAKVIGYSGGMWVVIHNFKT